MVVCEVCGAENRDRARFCRGCTHILVAVTVVEEPAFITSDGRPATRPCPTCQAPNPRRSLSCLACGAPLGQRRKVLAAESAAASGTPAAEVAEAPAPLWHVSRTVWLGGLLALVVIALIGWWYSAFRAQLPAVPSVASEASVAPATGQVSEALVQTPAQVPVAASATAAPPLTATPASTEPGTAPAVNQLNQAVEEVRLREQRKTAERVAAQERAREARIAERQRVQEARVLAAKEAAAAAAMASAASAVAHAPPPVPAPPPAKTVAQTCAGETNIFARDFCRIDACRLPANVKDTICVSYRQMEAERRARMAN